MKLKNLYYLVIIVYLIPSNFAYSIDPPNIKNLILHKDKIKIENVEFINSKKQKVSLNSYNSNLVIINFWATWCAPCREEMPSLDKLKLINITKNIEILPINIAEESYEKSKAFFEDINIKNLEIFHGSSVELAKKFNIRGIPTTIIIDKNGYEIARIIGYIDFQNKSFLNWLNHYL
tara:strand:+ start:40 stop:570 length:531 start_codon:yes stop_codon:yes gene_type:complete